jgi:hypothetical protein
VLVLPQKLPFATSRSVVGTQLYYTRTSRSEYEKAGLKPFRREVNNLAHLPGIINEAAKLMGVQ